MDMEFPRGRRGRNSRGWGSTVKPPWNGGSNWKKSLHGGMEILWNHTLSGLSVLL